jgi:hypothetical protein
MTWRKMQRKENGHRKNLSESRTGRGETFPRTEPKAGFLVSRLGGLKARLYPKSRRISPGPTPECGSQTQGKNF